MLTVRRLLGMLVAIALTFAGVSAVAAQAEVTPGITVQDQAIYITVDSVISDGPGWVVVHRDDNGSPGDVIGMAAVQDGENEDVKVELDSTQLTEILHIMLHEDTGTEGTFEFGENGGDAPVQIDGETIVTTIMLNMPGQFPVTGEIDDDLDATPMPLTDDDDDADVDVDVDVDDDADVDDADVDVDDADVDDEDVGATDTDDDEVLPETGANLSMLPMLGLAAAGALLVGLGLVFAYRKQD